MFLKISPEIKTGETVKVYQKTLRGIHPFLQGESSICFRVFGSKSRFHPFFTRLQKIFAMPCAFDELALLLGKS